VIDIIRFRLGRDQQWLLRGDSSPSFKIGGPPRGKGRRDERKSLTGSRSGTVLFSGLLSLDMLCCSKCCRATSWRPRSSGDIGAMIGQTG
jgi:hypothetical protein